MRSDSLTKQAFLLMAGRILALPLNFLVPIILVRTLAIDQFGIYKQLFMMFYILLPVIDLGIAQSLFYFIPKFPDNRDRIISQTFFLQVPLIVGLAAAFFGFRHEIGMGFSGGDDVPAGYIPYLGMFVLLWHLSNILENLLIVEKKAFQAGAMTFFSEALRSIVTIAIGLSGGGVIDILMGLVGTSVLRCGLMGWYVARTVRFSARIQGRMIRSQLAYALPFGMAVIVRTFFMFSHQYIVSMAGTSSDFAIYAVGCFSLPFIAIIVDSVAKTSLVRMSEATTHPDGPQVIAGIVHNAIRKLWLLFFPVYVLLFVMAEEFIILLFTESYRASIPVFRYFIVMIPLSALLIQHVPRALDRTGFILANNLSAFCLSVVLCFFFYYWVGPAGAAAGFILANILWRLAFFVGCGKSLNVPIQRLLPIASMLKVSFAVLPTGGVIHYVKEWATLSMGMDLVWGAILFGVICSILYWCLPILLVEEKDAVKKRVLKLRAQVFQSG